MDKKRPEIKAIRRNPQWATRREAEEKASSRPGAPWNASFTENGEGVDERRAGS
jgi:hypothetical protein